MDIDQLNLDFGHEPTLAAPTTYLNVGRRALRRRRLTQGLGGSVAALAIGSVAWAALPGTGTAGDQPFSATPTPIVTTSLPVVAPDDCLGEVCVELVPHGREPLSPASPGGDMALGFRDGQLVRFSSAVQVVKAIKDPTGTGAVESAAVEVVFRDTRFRVAMAAGFGYLIDEVGPAAPPTLEQWFAERHALPDSGCGVQSPGSTLSRIETPGPGECWVETDAHGKVVPAAGISLIRQFTATVPAGKLPPGVTATGIAFEREGVQWFGVVRQVGDGVFVSTTLVRVQDLAPGTTLETWVAKTAPETSESGVPDLAQIRPWQSLRWWDPKTGDFLVPDGAAVVRRVDNPLGRRTPDNSAGLIYDFDGKRYWSLTEVHAVPSDAATDDTPTADDVRTAGVTVTQAEAAAASADFDTWLAAEVADRLHGESTP